MPKPAQLSIINDLIAAIIENQKGSDMESLGFDNICVRSQEEFPEMEEERFINALVNSSITKLTRLGMDGNTEWFRQE